jgi:5S rRNA maturation endonuclease (ribonuclease M5)
MNAVNAATVAAVLDNARQTSTGWQACCPVHDDRKPSLSITDQDDKVLVFCHAGCDQRAVVDAIAARGIHLNGHTAGIDGPPNDHPKLGRPSATWDYYADDGRHVGRVLRFDTATGKEIRQASHNGTRWTWKAMTEPRPLYRLREVQRRPTATVVVCEGEKAADAAQRHFPAHVVVTWSGGSKAVMQSEWRTLAGRAVILWPDADAPGRMAMDTLARVLKSHGCDVQMVDLAAFGNVPEGWDAADCTLDQVTKFRTTPHVEQPIEAPATTLADIEAGTYTSTLWLLYGLLCVGAFLIVGRPKIGKSWWLLQLATALGRGFEFLGYAPTGALHGLVILAEDTKERVQRRIRATGQTPPGTVTVWTQQEFTDLAAKYSGSMNLTDFLDRYLEQHPQCRFVLIDTETTCRAIWEGEAQAKDNRRITEKDYSQTRAFDVLALRRRVFIGLVNHTGKMAGKREADPHELVNRTNVALAGCSGSIVLTGYPDADPLDASDRRRLLAVRGRDLDDDLLLAVEHQRNGEFTSLGAYSQVRQTELEEDVLEAIAAMTADTPGEYVTYKAIASELDCSRDNVKRAVRQMREKNRVTWKGKRLEVRKGPEGGARLMEIVE